MEIIGLVVLILTVMVIKINISLGIITFKNQKNDMWEILLSVLSWIVFSVNIIWIYPFILNEIMKIMDINFIWTIKRVFGLTCAISLFNNSDNVAKISVLWKKSLQK